MPLEINRLIRECEDCTKTKTDEKQHFYLFRISNGTLFCRNCLKTFDDPREVQRQEEKINAGFEAMENNLEQAAQPEEPPVQESLLETEINSNVIES